MVENKRTLSLIVPVYNVEPYLASCIDSLLAQEVEGMELIFIDDASTDNSFGIIKRYQEEYPDIIVLLHNEKNIRQGGARNRGLRCAKGEYVAFVDSDDFLLPGIYRKLHEKIVESDADAVYMSACMVGPNEQFSAKKQNYENIHIINSKNLQDYVGFEFDEATRCRFIASQNAGSIWQGIYKKKLILDNDLFFPENTRFEDNYWVSLLRCYLKKIDYIEDVGYFYRYNPAGSSKSRNCSFYDDRRNVENLLLNEVKNRGLFEVYYDAWEQLYSSRYGINTCMAYITRFDTTQEKKIQIVKQDVDQNFPNWYKNKYYPNTLRSIVRRNILNFSTVPIINQFIFLFVRFYYKKYVLWKE